MQTSQEIRNEWNKENLKHYNVVFRKDTDQELIDYIERKKAERKKADKRNTTSEIFRVAIERMMKEENGE